MDAKLIASALLAMLMPSISYAGSVDEVSRQLKQLYPASSFETVRETPISGLKEVQMGKNIVYVSDDGKYFVFGHLFEMASQRDLTEERMADLNKTDFKLLPLQNAIKIVKGNGQRKVAVFSDPDCPYCMTLEQQMKGLNHATIYLFLNPLAGLHPGAMKKSVSIWCAANRQRAWTDWMLGKIMPKDQECPNPVADNVRLASSLGISGTPSMISEDGRIQQGAMELDKLDAWLGAAK